MSLALLNIRIVEHNIRNIKNINLNIRIVVRSIVHVNIQTQSSVLIIGLCSLKLYRKQDSYVEVSFSKPEKRRRAVLAVRSIN